MSVSPTPAWRGGPAPCLGELNEKGQSCHGSAGREHPWASIGVQGRLGAELPDGHFGVVVERTSGDNAAVVPDLGQQSPRRAARNARLAPNMSSAPRPQTSSWSAPLLHQGQRVGVVIEPFGHPDAGLAPRPHERAAIGQGGSMGDHGACPDVHPLVASAHLGAPGDQDDPEPGIAGQAVRRSALGSVARRRAGAAAHAGKRTVERGNIAQAPPPGPIACMPRSSPPHCHVPRHWPRSTGPGDASRTGGEAGPELVVVLCWQQNRSAPAIGAVGAGGGPDGLPAHAPARVGLIHTPSISPSDLTASRHRSDIGDAGSTRRIAFLGRACRCHRQLLSTQGNGREPIAVVGPVSASLSHCEPHVNRSFAKVLVAGVLATQSSPC